MGNVSPIGMQKDKAQSLVRQLAKDSANIIFINDCTDGEWERAINYRQMLVCLEKGKVISSPKWDVDSETWQFQMYRFAAGQEITLTIAVGKDENELYIINVCQ